MTVLVSSVSDKLIVMLSDSTITTTHFTDEQGNFYNDYDTGSKYYKFPGVGCITTWGDKTYNSLSNYLQRQTVSSDRHSVEDLAQFVRRYIANEYRKDVSDEVGYHIGGFDRNGHPRLYHVFWGFDRPKHQEQLMPSEHFYEHSDWAFLYNGRNDLAHVVFTALQDEIRNGQNVHFDLNTSVGRICLCDFVARFAAEITPQVGPPFVIHLIFPDNTIEKIENTSFSPISLQRIASVMPKLLEEGRFVFRPSSQANPVDNHMPTGTVFVVDETPQSSEPGTITYIPPSGIKRKPYG